MIDMFFSVKLCAGLAVLFFILPDKRKLIAPLAITAALAVFAASVFALFQKDVSPFAQTYLLNDNISKAVYFLIAFFGILLAIYSSGFINEKLNKCKKALFKQGFQEYRKGNLSKTIALWQDLLTIDPQNTDIKESLRTAKLQQKNLQEKE